MSLAQLLTRLNLKIFMIDLQLIYDLSTLSRSKVYSIKGTLYRYIGQDPYAQINHPIWQFKPLANQRKKTELRLNKNSVRGWIYEVPGMSQNIDIKSSEVVQLKLF